MDLIETWFVAAVSGAGLFRPVAALLVFLAFLFSRGVITNFLFDLTSRIASRSKKEIDLSFFLALEAPLKNFILVLGIYIALSILSLGPPWESYFTVLFRILVVVFVAWGLYNLTESRPFKVLSKRYRLDPLLASFLVKAVKAVIVALAVVMIIQQLGYNVSGVIAGLGLGGLAVALAAQDALANIFAGIVIIADRPFSVGDWISTPAVEGTVEEVSFRSTKIRTFAQALVTVPNKVLANEAVTNWTRMGKRRVSFNLQVALHTPREKLERCVRRIRETLQNDPDIHPETILVYFESFGESSLEIILYFFTKTTAYAEYLAVKESINFKIIEILEDEGVTLARPARSIYFDAPSQQS